jgi:MGT family glycosyltransferase
MTPKRFLFAIWPFVGHVYPHLSVALELRARGHEVAFYSGDSVRSTLDDEGVQLFPFQRVNQDDVLGTVQALEAGAPVGWQAPMLVLRAFRDWLAGTIPEQVADLTPIIESWRPDVVVAETGMWGPILVLWESKRVPVAILSTLMGCLVPGPDAPPWGPGLPPPRTFRTRLVSRLATMATDKLAAPVRRRVNQARAAHGLPPLRTSVNAYTGRLPLYLVPSLPSLDYERRDLPPSVHYVGPCVMNKTSQSAPPAWLDEIRTDQPWVHVTEGTAHYQDPFVLRAAARGLANLPIQVILTSGPQRDPASLELGELAPNIRLEQWVSHTDLLPRCAAMVTTGGAGTVKATLLAGVPLVVVPTHWDKADNAQRIAAAGAGLRLSPKQCTPERLRAAVQRLLDEPSFRSRARELARQLAAEPGPPRAASLLENLAHRTSGQGSARERPALAPR